MTKNFNAENTVFYAKYSGGYPSNLRADNSTGDCQKIYTEGPEFFV